MSLYMFFYQLPDEHIYFLERNPKLISGYRKGVTPKHSTGMFSKLLFKKIEDIPVDWPKQELSPFSSEINHTMVNDYHYYLNGSGSDVSHEGCLFQTWVNPNQDTAAIKIDNETFAFNFNSCVKLLDRLNSLDSSVLKQRYIELHGVDSVDEEASILSQDIEELKKFCETSVEHGYGILWSTS